MLCRREFDRKDDETMEVVLFRYVQETYSKECMSEVFDTVRDCVRPLTVDTVCHFV